MYYTYIIRCNDNSLYTGMTSNIKNRILEHKNGVGAKYTKAHRFSKVEAVWSCKTKSLACKLEYYIKTLNKKEKEDIIVGKALSNFFDNKIDYNSYKREKNIFKNL